MAIEAVVFDIGRVLIEWNPERFFDAEYGEEHRRRLFDAVDLHDMNNDIDRGADFRETVYATAEQYPEWSAEIRHWHDSWIHLASPEIPHSVRLMRALKARGTPVYVLSNIGIGTYAIAREAYPFLAEFNRLFLSGELQRVKPEPEIYAAVEEATGVAPASLLFADDLPKNIEAAAARGWQTHLFTTPEGWAARLVQEGLLREEEAL